MVASVMDLVNPKDPPAIANWITHDPSDDDAILDQLERSIPVRLIATLGEYTAAFADELAIDAENRATAHRFDFLPVRATERGGVVGLFRRGAGRPSGPSTVRQVMQPLDGATNLISADAPLIDFVVTADTCPCRLVLDGTEIRGLVTRSDLQRLPVRTILFGLFIHLELLLTDVLKPLVGPNVEPFDLLEKEEARRARTIWNRAIGSGMDRDIYSSLFFSDKILIARKLHVLGKPDDETERELTEIERLIRHPIAHGKSFALTPAEADALVRATRLMRDWIDCLRLDCLKLHLRSV